MSLSNLLKVFTETRLEDVDLSKTQPCKYFIYMDATAINFDIFWRAQSFGTSNSWP